MFSYKRLLWRHHQKCSVVQILYCLVSYGVLRGRIVWKEAAIARWKGRHVSWSSLLFSTVTQQHIKVKSCTEPGRLSCSQSLMALWVFGVTKPTTVEKPYNTCLPAMCIHKLYSRPQSSFVLKTNLCGLDTHLAKRFLVSVENPQNLWSVYPPLMSTEYWQQNKKLPPSFYFLYSKIFSNLKLNIFFVFSMFEQNK